MRKVHKNAVFEAVRNTLEGLKTFNIDFHESGLVVRIQHLLPNSPMWFELEQNEDDFDHFDVYQVEFSPKFPYVKVGSSNVMSVALQRFNRWVEIQLTSYIEDLETEDLYEAYIRGEQLLGVENISFNETEDFSLEQKTQIKLGFAELKFILARDYANNDNQIKLINDRLDYLIDAVDRLNKTDWKGILISTVIGMITSLTLDRERGAELMNLFINIIHIAPTLFPNMGTP